jgi:NAD kinase
MCCVWVIAVVNVNITVFWDVTPRSLVEDTNISEEHIAYIFTSGGGSRFLRNARLFFNDCFSVYTIQCTVVG